MFDWSDDQQQVGDTIWAELHESEDHTVPYPKVAEDSTLVSVGDHKNNGEKAARIACTTEGSAGGQTEFQDLEKQPANLTSGQFSAARLDMESWPDLPSLNPTLDRKYSDENIASTYLDFSAEPSLQKVAGNTTEQLDGEPEVVGKDLEEESNNFLDCDWGNIGDFDDFDRLFSSSDSIFVNEMVGNGSDFLSTSSDLMDNTVQSIPSPIKPLSKQPSSDHVPCSLLINEISGEIITQENKVADANAKSGEQAESKNHLTCEYSGKRNQLLQERDVRKRSVRSRRKLEERGKGKITSSTSGLSQSRRHNTPASLQASMSPVQTPEYATFHDGKNMGLVQHVNQIMFPGYGYPSYPIPTIPLLSSIQAAGHQTSCRTSTYSPKHSSSIEKAQDIPPISLTMTPQEKIEKLRRRQQMQALIAIRKQQQQFGHVGSGSDTVVPQVYSPGNKNTDSFGSSIIIDENAINVFSSVLNPCSHDELHKGSTVPDDPYIEEKIYYQLQDALGKLDTRTRLCIRDSLLRLARSAAERQIACDRSSSSKTNKDEDEASEIDTSSKRKRSPTTEEETNTNPIDRIVAHLLFHRHCSKVAAPAIEEIISSTPLALEPDSEMPFETRDLLEEH